MIAAVVWERWALLLAGCGLFGGGNAAVMLARYAAADLATRRARSISALVTAGSAGAIAGPNLLGPTGSLAHTFGLPAPAGLFLLAIPTFLGAALVLLVFLRPDPLHVARASVEAIGTDDPQPVAGAHKETFADALGDRHIRLALLVFAVSSLSMVSVIAGSALLHEAPLSPSLRRHRDIFERDPASGSRPRMLRPT